MHNSEVFTGVTNLSLSGNYSMTIIINLKYISVPVICQTSSPNPGKFLSARRTFKLLPTEYRACSV